MSFLNIGRAQRGPDSRVIGEEGRRNRALVLRRRRPAFPLLAEARRAVRRRVEARGTRVEFLLLGR